MEQCRALADKGDATAAFQLGVSYLIGMGVTQDAVSAEKYFSKVPMTSSQMCFVAETYMETALPGKIDSAERWVTKADAGCTDWLQAHWYAGNQLGPDPEKEVAFLRKGLDRKHNAYRHSSEQRLGELLLQGTVIEASAANRTHWTGAAARARMGLAESWVAVLYGRHPELPEQLEAQLEWVRNGARYGAPNALNGLGAAAINRQASDLSYLDGMALVSLALRQDFMSAPQLDAQIAQLDPAFQEEVKNAVGRWEGMARDTGGYYTQRDPFRLNAPEGEKDWEHRATPQDPDAELRFAYIEEMAGHLAKAEALYREVWHNGAAELFWKLGTQAARAQKWVWARELLVAGADYGSRMSCSVLSTIDSQGLAGEKDNLSAYLWMLRGEMKPEKDLALARQKLTPNELLDAPMAEAQWILAHKEFWPNAAKAAQVVIDAEQVKRYQDHKFVQFQRAPEVPISDLKASADKGDLEAAYDVANRMLREGADAKGLEQVEHYAALGAVTPMHKVGIANSYEQATALNDETRRKYVVKWMTAAGGSLGPYSLGKIYNGKSDGTVATEEEKKAVEYWEQSVAAGDERWARLSRMELGYRVIKGWKSGNRANDAQWAHELAMEFLGKHLYEVAGEYSYGRELAHDPQLFALLSERSSVYNHDNAQSQVAQAIQNGEWNRRDEIDAYVWMKLHAVKQDTGDGQVVALAENDASLKAKIEERYRQLLKTRQESGAYYPQDDPLRTAAAAELEPRAKELDPEAQLRLGTLLEDQGDAKSMERAIEFYRRIWADSSWEVRLTWGRILMHGAAGVPRDDVGAQKFLFDAANEGSHEACRDLAVIYEEGRGVQADPVATEAWRELADASAAANAKLTDAQRRAVRERIADWRGKHPQW
jgi:TPR repeat protein